MNLLVRQGSIHELLHEPEALPGVGIGWLGQAGFALRWAGLRLLIDPYLSDSLAIKYRGTEFPHQRMMPPPVVPGELRELDWVLCTHGHSDHMDPGTLPELAAHNPRCRFVVPRADSEKALSRGVPPERLVAVNAEEQLTLGEDAQLSVLPSAHEELQVNDRGEYFCLGFVLRLGRCTVYHPGDCVPFAGQAARLQRERPDIALLPVNGRDEYRRSRGVPGNMDLGEAVELCVAARIPWLVPQHFGMFDFNTVDEGDLATALTDLPPGLNAVLPRVGQILQAS